MTGATVGPNVACGLGPLFVTTARGNHLSAYRRARSDSASTWTVTCNGRSDRGAFEAQWRYAARMEKPAFALGSRVQHAKFGKGDVTGRQGTGDATKIEIRFEDGVTRLLAVAFIKPL